MAHGPSLGGQTHTHLEADISDLDHTDPEAIHDNVSGEINALTEKTTPVDADLLLIEDSEASYAKKKLQIQNASSGGDIVFQDNDWADSGTELVDDVVSTLWTKTLTLAAGDILIVESVLFLSSTGADDMVGWHDAGDNATDAVPQTSDNYSTESYKQVRTGIVVIDSSNAFFSDFENQSVSGLTSTDSGDFAIASRNYTARYEEISADLTGSTDIKLKVFTNTSALTVHYLSTIRKFAAT